MEENFEDELFASMIPHGKYKYAALPQASRMKRIRPNKVALDYTVPFTSQMVPANEWDEKQGWGQAGWKVRYINYVRLRIRPANET